MCGIGPDARRAGNRRRAGEESHHHLGRGAEGGHRTGGSVEYAGAAHQDHAHDQVGDVLDEHMVATFLPLAEEDDRLAFLRKAAEAVGAIAVVRVCGAKNQGRANDAERSGPGVLQAEFARQMHHAVQAARRGGAPLVERYRLVAVNRIGTDIDKVRR